MVIKPGDKVKILSSGTDDIPEIAAMIGQECIVDFVHTHGGLEVKQPGHPTNTWMFSSREVKLVEEAE